MKFKNLFQTELSSEIESEFRLSALGDNIRRTKVFACIVIFLEILLAATDMVTSFLNVDKRFHFDAYLIAYCSMIVVNVLILFTIRTIGDIKEKPQKRIRFYEIIVLVYITFMLCWGSIVSLMDQKLYGQLTVFMINMIVCSVLFYIELRKIILPFIISILILAVGLPFAQPSSDVLIGHYVNLIIFVAISFVSSRILFHNFLNDFKNKLSLRAAHNELHKISYMDELTCLPNRRSYNNYIEEHFIKGFKSGTEISVIMIDIDFFKQYNDNYGHFEGDKVLEQVAEQIYIMASKFGGFAARIGGEEFVCLCGNETGETMFQLAEDLRRNILDLKIPHYYSRFAYLTVSLGISKLLLQNKDDIYSCIDLADQALYDAKKSGRNCVKTYDSSPSKKQEALSGKDL